MVSALDGQTLVTNREQRGILLHLNVLISPLSYRYTDCVDTSTELAGDVVTSRRSKKLHCRFRMFSD